MGNAFAMHKLDCIDNLLEYFMYNFLVSKMLCWFKVIKIAFYGIFHNDNWSDELILYTNKNMLLEIEYSDDIVML